MRLIDADDAIRKMDSVMDMQELYLPIHFKEWVIDEVPTIDAVQVVRCKDCEYGEQDEVGRWFCRSLGCQIGNEDGCGYCADAERRTDETD